MSFRFTARDFRNARPNRSSLRKLKDRFLTLQSLVISKLPDEFANFKRKRAHYVCRIARQTGELRDGLWLGMADGQIYKDPRKGVQLQFGINKNKADVYGIWVEGTYYARPTRLKLASALVKRRNEFFRLLRSLPSVFRVRFTTKDLDRFLHIGVKDISDADVDELIQVLPKRDTYLEIGPSPAKTGSSLTRTDIIALEDDLPNHIVRTFWKLLPLYRFMSREREELARPRSGRPLSTQIIHESSTWGMKTAMRFERQNRRTPRDVSLTTEGYDILSKSRRGTTRCIEVKSRRGGYRVVLTPHEYETAKKESNRYYLYVIRGDGSIWIVRNPARSCRFEEVKVTEFEVTDWIQKATRHCLRRMIN